MLHHMDQHDIQMRLRMIWHDRKIAQLRRDGYREFREPRIKRHWANR